MIIKIFRFSLFLICFITQLLVFAKAAEAKHIDREGEPIVTLRKLYVPESARQGEVVKLSADMSISKNMWQDAGIFLHICKPPDNEILVNNDFTPSTPTTMWVVGDIITVGPVNLFIPPDFPVGDYSIEMGLFTTRATAKEHLYIREPYTNPEIKKYIVGTIRVEAASAGKEAKKEDLIISDFESLVDLRKWTLKGALLDQDTEHTIDGSASAGKVTFLKGGAVRLESFFRYCHPKYVDWSPYDELHFSIYGPPDEAGKTYLQRAIRLLIKDKSGRRFEQPLPKRSEKDKPVILNIAKIGEIIDITDIGDFTFLSESRTPDQVIFLDDIKLVSLGIKKDVGPFIKFEELKLSSDRIKPGEEIEIEAAFSITRKFTKQYEMFIHIYRATDRKGWINADISPSPSTMLWQVNEKITQGPLRIYIPYNSPPGVYNIEIGLFLHQKTPSGADYVKYHREKNGVYYVQQPQWPSDYFKQPYINYEEYGDWVVGSFEVVSE